MLSNSGSFCSVRSITVDARNNLLIRPGTFFLCVPFLHIPKFNFNCFSILTGDAVCNGSGESEEGPAQLQEKVNGNQDPK